MNTLSRLAGACSLAATAAVVLCAPTWVWSADGAADDRLYGASSPFLSHELPASRLRTEFSSLSSPAQQRALRWLHRFDFPARDANSLRVTRDGDVLYADLPPDRTDKSLAAAAQSAASQPTPFLQQAAETPFALHSRPGARHTAYIDFDGHVIRDTAWNAASGTKVYTARPFDLDGDPSNFSAEERYAIAKIWSRVAEDYAPFDINITTEAPARFNPEVGHVVVTSQKSAEGHLMPFNESAGVAYVGTWGRSDTAYFAPALVYFDNLWRDASMIAESVAHELGHAVGLSHDGTIHAEYYNGHGEGDISWAPIMGRSYYKNVTQWSRGEYEFANNPQDDIAIIESVLGRAQDDHGDTWGSATPLLIEGGLLEASDPESDPHNDYPENKGVIGNAGDVDVFAFDTGGEVRLRVQPAWKAFEHPDARGANLDLKLKLLDAEGQQVARSNPLQATHAVIDADLAPGRYYLVVHGVGSPNASVYGSLGQYYISGSVEPPPGNQLPDVGFGFACVGLECSFSDLSTDPDGRIVAWRWDFGDGTFSDQPDPRHRFPAGGDYVVTLTVTDDTDGTATAAHTVRVAGLAMQFEIIADDTSPDTTRTGHWNVSLGKGPWGSGSVYNNENRVFQWSPTVPVAGNYTVYAWWTYHDNRSDEVPYTVEHAAGTSTVVVNQRDPSLASQWVTLGTYEFVAGPALVTISSENGQANADAIRLVSVADLPVDSRPPEILFMNPGDGAAVQGVVALQADARDDAAVDRVEFRVDGALVGSTSRLPYAVDWDSRQVADGSRVVEATAFDINGNTATSAITLLVENDTAPFEVIVDNTDDATEMDGSWNASSAPSAWRDGSVYSNANGRFHWMPVLPGRGHYEVAAWWTFHPNRSTEVPYRIAHAGGETVVGADQSDPANAGRWIPLGTFEFAGGRTTVTVSSENGQASADAIRVRALDTPVVDTRSPEISIIAPTDNARVGNKVSVVAEASDDVGVLRVEFLVDGVVVAEARAAEYAAELDLGNAGDTDVVLTARAYDAAGNVARHSVTVKRSWPVAKLATIVDNTSGETASTGDWAVSAGAGPWDTDSLFSNANGTFRWLPELASAGRYEVFAWWTHHTNRSDRVPYRLTHRSGTSEILVDQRDPLLASQWVSLGVFDFDSGVAPVEVSSENGQASADAVMFVFQ